MPDENGAPADTSPDVVAHLQSAALELIAAARAVLDAAEHAVRHPAGTVDLVSLLSGLARPKDGRDEGGGDGGGVERIPVS